jgi:hypothetical protein
MQSYVVTKISQQQKWQLLVHLLHEQILFSAQPGTAHHTEEQFLSKVFLWVAVLFIFWLLIA